MSRYNYLYFCLYVFAFLGLTCYPIPGQSGQRFTKAKEEIEDRQKQHKQSPFKSLPPFKVTTCNDAFLPDDLLQKVISYLDPRCLCSMSGVSKYCFNLSEPYITEYLNNNYDNDKDSISFAIIVESRTWHYSTFYDLSTTYDPFSDFKTPKVASYVLKTSDDLFDFFKQGLEKLEKMIASAIKSKGILREKTDKKNPLPLIIRADFRDMSKHSSLHAQLKQYFLCLKLLANHDELAEAKRHAFSVNIMNALTHMHKRLLDSNSKPNEFLLRDYQLLIMPNWVAYIANSDRVPTIHMQVLCALMQSSVAKSLDYASTDAFGSYYFSNYGENENRFLRPYTLGLQHLKKGE